MHVFLVANDGELDSVWRSKRKALARAKQLACAGPYGISEARARHCIKEATEEARGGCLLGCVLSALAGPGPRVTVEEWPLS